jgi:hypothetical protein
MIKIDVSSNIKRLSASLDRLAQKQLPYATAQALNKVAGRVKPAEQQNIRDKFTKPTPFTQNSIGVSRANKASLTAAVFVKDIAAKYLQPYEDGGKHFLSSRALLNPKDIRLNQYGQLPRATLAKLKARPDIFIGIVKTKAGPVNGVWQRVTAPGRKLVAANGRRLRGLNQGPTATLKLLIRFGDALPVNKCLEFGATGQRVVDAHLQGDFADALAAALSIAR